MPETSIDVPAFFAALNKKRSAEGFSWRVLAKQLCIPPSTFSRMSQGKRPDLDTFATLLSWLDMPADIFMRSSTRQKHSVNPVAMISSYLRADKNISAEDAEALEDIIQAAYRGFILNKEHRDEE